ncbi:MAG: TlyA family RNA methyltransferase [Clostridia bacterium]|nr:TlyA family RNA methyltransferase [Clostridia bacterium]
MEGDKMRADAALVKRGLAASREKAQALIASRLATVNGAIIAKPAQRVGEGDALAVHGAAHPYVSRGGLKLEKALRVFRADVTGAVCVDIGASTGGFTDVLLQSGAELVYAVDVGTGQLDATLLKDQRVVSMERVNARMLEASMFPARPTLGVMDVSFISIKLILPAALAVLGEAGRMITLVKPQFEAGRQAVGKGGIVSKPAIHRQVLREIVDFVPALGWRVRALDFSPIAGGDGNIEFLADIAPQKNCDTFVSQANIDAVVKAAHDKI